MSQPIPGPPATPVDLTVPAGAAGLHRHCPLTPQHAEQKHPSRVP
jgi:hypothetical protein